jgi:hypothetical protein
MPITQVRDEHDNPVVGATVQVLYNGVLYEGLTGTDGCYYTSYIMNAKKGTYYDDVVDLALQDYLWNNDLDLEDDDAGDDNDYIDDYFVKT